MSVQLTKLEREFDRQVQADLEEAKAHGYVPGYFLKERANNPKLSAGVAHQLLGTTKVQEGFYRMWELGLVERTIEWRVLEERWSDLFSVQEKREAYRRLVSIGATPPSKPPGVA